MNGNLRNRGNVKGNEFEFPRVWGRFWEQILGGILGEIIRKIFEISVR